MVRGILSGGVFGVVVSGLALVIISQLAERRVLAPVPQAQTETIGDLNPEQGDEGDAPDAPLSEPLQPEASEPVTPQQPAPDIIAPDEPMQGSAEPTPAPDVIDIPSQSAPLPETTAAPNAPAVENAPDLADPTAALAPISDADAPPSIAPPAPATPGVAPETNSRAPDGFAMIGAGDDAPQAPAPENTPRLPDAPAGPMGPGPVVVTALAVPNLQPSGGADTSPTAPDASQHAVFSPSVPTRPAPIMAEADLPEPIPAAPLSVAAGAADIEAPGAPDITSPPEDETPVTVAARPQPPGGDTAASPLPNAGAAPAPREPVVITNRLPRIGDAVPEAEIAQDAPETPLAPDALTRNGEPFANPDSSPIVAVVLLDEGGPEITLPIPVSVAVNARAPDAAERMARYRAAGIEVLLTPDFPAGAQPTDVAVSLQDAFTRLPDAVAVIDTPSGDLSGNRDVLAQMISELAETGHGFLTFPKGLNTALQVANRGGVSAALVFREIDSAGQDQRAIKRFLDQAAFRARQENAVILVGRNQPETIAALAEWALGNRAASVALAPVSAALNALTD
ncbi:divergent polysaccharide deacetylase family protein [Oceaniglobus ichthyenteri]|uniref:divergent polysaccharide deacetylase family protein n=1 Tax=Oceaniglobus ichthyenteri TaxID=2136177 RepID=UPI0013DDBDD6|nr:divergent polysaccharide deacetylase family protein [Oceaniglobus ichthyenteri]